MLSFTLNSMSLCSNPFPDFFKECGRENSLNQPELLKVGLLQLSFILPGSDMPQRKHPHPSPFGCVFHKQEISHTFIPYSK